MSAGWQDNIWQALKKGGIAQVAYVPDAGHESLIRAAHGDAAIKTTVLTSEDEGIGVMAGADLGGERGVLLMQSSGVGNCVNAFSLLKVCGFPFLTLVTMRGEWAEFNPWQMPMGQATPETLSRAGFLVYRVECPDDAGPTVAAALANAYDSASANAVLLSQRLIGAKVF
jgi:sulfopyruvate decarboxylase alpha subunit